jgi:hypothetical protein
MHGYKHLHKVSGATSIGSNGHTPDKKIMKKLFGVSIMFAALTLGFSLPYQLQPS